VYSKTLRNLSFGRRRPPNERAERWSSRQIVEYFMTAVGVGVGVGRPVVG
jgi:hypothetical protein